MELSGLGLPDSCSPTFCICKESNPLCWRRGAGSTSRSACAREFSRPTLIFVALISAMAPLTYQVPILIAHPWLMAGAGFLVNGGQGIAPLVLVLAPTESVPAKFAATAIGLATLVGETIGRGDSSGAGWRGRKLLRPRGTAVDCQRRSNFGFAGVFVYDGNCSVQDRPARIA